MFYEELHEIGSHWLKAVTKDTNEIAGFAKWQAPKHGIEPELDLPTWPEEADKTLCNETFGQWAKLHQKLMGKRGHWYLEIVATDSAFQGKGAGSTMMRWALRQADEQGVEAYLEASPDAVPLYNRMGFSEAGRTDTFIDNERVQGVWYRNLCMVRPVSEISGPMVLKDGQSALRGGS